MAFCDSGVGGLELLKRVASAFPDENFVYLADSDNLPYGNKSEAEMRIIADSVITKLLSFAPKLIVTACNTLSVTLNDEKRDRGVKIIGVLPRGGVGRGYVFCTPRTATCKYVRTLTATGAYVAGIDGLAGEIEYDVLNHKIVDVKHYFDGYDTAVDYVSLGCTHYGLVRSEIHKIFPDSAIIDGIDETEKQIVSFLRDHPCERDKGEVCFLGKKRRKIQDYYLNFL